MKALIWLVTITFLFSFIITSCSSPPSSSTAANILVATDATVPPFENLNPQTQKFEGLDIDIFNAIGAKQNMHPTYKIVEWDPLLAGMAKGLYDAAISTIPITEDRKKDMLF